MTRGRASMTRTQREAGFTLVEMLVALALLSMVGLALVQFQTVQLGASARLSSATLAGIEADNRMVDLLLAKTAPAAATSTTVTQNGGRPWRVAQAVLPGPTETSARIDVAVSDESGVVLASRTLTRPR